VDTRPSTGGETWSEVKAAADEEPAVACGALAACSGVRAVRVDGISQARAPWTPEATKEKKPSPASRLRAPRPGDWQPLPARGELNVKTMDLSPTVRFRDPTTDIKDGSAKLLVVGGEPKTPSSKAWPGNHRTSELTLLRRSTP